eukprot:TRINITY_DN53608_c0_g1_i1.p1 TRINITY_DN53608_c0_g1~~TRINITY_DN53608_c0_g1_i1.p1  ORF type:complete len:170 (-),score=38.78 TRINITY_DN53608_c0_g1_i1:224-733(-)
MAYCGLGPILRKARQEAEADSEDEMQRVDEHLRPTADVVAAAFRRTSGGSSRPSAKAEAKRETGKAAQTVRKQATVTTSQGQGGAGGKARISKAERKKAKKSNGPSSPKLTAAPAPTTEVKKCSESPLDNVGKTTGRDSQDNLKVKKSKATASHAQPGSKKRRKGAVGA